MAAPGRMAWLMASPIRLMRRSIEKHADRRRAERQRKAADQRPAHEGEFDEGIDEGSGSCRLPLAGASSALANLRLLVEGLGELARLAPDCSGVSTCLRRSPGHDLAGDAAASAGNARAPARCRAARR